MNLATLLRSWRARVQPADVGLPFRAGTRRTDGLRREEVAWLAGVSPDYVKRLEQGRAHPSAAVLTALSRALRLSDAEYELACRLAGHAPRAAGTVPRRIGPSVQRLLDRFADTPIAVFDATWTLLEHNELWTALTGDTHPRGTRATNLVWRFFHGETGRVRHPDPDSYRAAMVTDLRDAAARYPADPELAGMIAQLRRDSDAFARLWADPTATAYGNERKTVDHPQVGALDLDCDILSVHGADLRIIVFTAAPGTEAEGRLRLLSVLGTQDMNTPA
ncbi:helix-turn-helix domain-containing protein [Catenuloplanes japonicus]|uniref:helix-turn-helix domain-containing protein n=1 Tax=Catenuloplanes japonicus TaxID=33876 RepID=UPI000ADBCD1E|nr:helix-turn-helix domain-containing protein [Catenuloplanes japonicus]